jgi:hydroxypyruvate reductase
VLVLLSGGASSLCEVPVEGLGLDDLANVSARLLGCGAPIDRVNEVRSGLSAFKAGGLGGALAEAHEVRVLALSDVVGSAPATIGSGPTVAHPFDPEMTIALAESCGVGLPHGLAERLRRAPVPKRVSFPVEVLADGRVLADAVVEAALAGGLRARVGEVLAGEASRTARRLATEAGAGLTVHAGETTVTVVGEAPGGRNQEAALAAAEVLAGTDGVFVSLGSDGVDGMTDAAGAVVDGGTWTEIEASGLDPAALLAANEAHRALDAVGALIRTGPTGTNVADVWAVWR